MKRYVEGGKKPKKLVSNWPDLVAPKQEHQKHWRYYVVRGTDNHVIYETKNLEKAYDYMQLMWTRTSKLYVRKYEPTSEALHDERAREKSEWRWQAGFGA